VGKGDARTRAHTYTHIHIHTYTHTHIYTHRGKQGTSSSLRFDCVSFANFPTHTYKGVYGGGYGEAGGEAGKGKRGKAHDINRFVSDSRADNGLGFRVLGFRV
jgi:hypothetical protein